jgi:hypothetical protein
VQNYFERAGQASAQILKNSLSDNADNVERAVKFSISTAMAAGDMDIFDKVSSLQKNLRGLEEFSLYTQNGRVAYPGLSKARPFPLRSGTPLVLVRSAFAGWPKHADSNWRGRVR